jgi:hypothetical protein
MAIRTNKFVLLVGASSIFWMIAASSLLAQEQAVEPLKQSSSSISEVVEDAEQPQKQQQTPGTIKVVNPVTATTFPAGSTEGTVRSALGEPTQVKVAEGVPQVTRWAYGDGTQVVFLEGVVVDVFKAPAK